MPKSPRFPRPAGSTASSARRLSGLPRPAAADRRRASRLLAGGLLAAADARPGAANRARTGRRGDALRLDAARSARGRGRAGPDRRASSPASWPRPRPTSRLIYRTKGPRYIGARAARPQHRRGSAPRKVAGVVPTDEEIAAYYKANRRPTAARETRVISQAVVRASPPPTPSPPAPAAGSFAAAATPAGFAADDIRRPANPRRNSPRWPATRSPPPPSPPHRARSSGRSSRTSAGTSIRIDAIQGEAGKTLAAARAEIVAQLTADKRKDALADLVAKVEDSIADGGSFPEAVKARRPDAVKSPLITRQRHRPRQPRLQVPRRSRPRAPRRLRLGARTTTPVSKRFPAMPAMRWSGSTR